MGNCDDISNNYKYVEHSRLLLYDNLCSMSEWTAMDGVQALIFKAGRRPATSWANAEFLSKK